MSVGGGQLHDRLDLARLETFGVGQSVLDGRVKRRGCRGAEDTRTPHKELGVGLEDRGGMESARVVGEPKGQIKRMW
jgi:hypothetical protein